MARLRAAIVGLGRIGSRFDEEPGRVAVWSHAGAYLSLPEHFELVAGCDHHSENLAAFGQRCGASLYEDLGAMLAETRPEVVSICTPAHSHAEVLRRVAAEAPQVRIVWCEKPMATSLAEAEEMVAIARQADIRLAVSHVRRWMPLWEKARAVIESGRLGTLRSLRVAMPNRLLSIGSHAVDLALFLGGPVEAVRALSLPAMAQDGEPAVTALLRYANGAGGVVQVTGMKAGLIVEAEVVGDAGRMTVSEGTGTVTVEKFVPNGAFMGYLQLAFEESLQVPTLSGHSPFVVVAREIAEMWQAPERRARCDANEALQAQRVLAAMAVEVEG